ncbi:MAG: phosphoribosyltransferase [Saprospiraceae bacterium]|nr:phosphoribosyltransferase [Saprospiraceae bacterium]
MKILTHRQIQQKVKRIAIEILEHHFDDTEIILAGINNNGYAFAMLLYQALSQELLQKNVQMSILLSRILLNPANPLAKEVQVEMPLEQIANKSVIVIDDVANTGRTLLYAIKPLIKVVPKKIEIAVLVDRKHKSFPIHADYIGLSLSTTLNDDIDVQIRNEDEWAVYIK